MSGFSEIEIIHNKYNQTSCALIGLLVCTALVFVLFPVTSAFAANISGTVFEDVNYGGGAGRSMATSSGVVRLGARVELYDAAGAFITSVPTSTATNRYTFTGLTAGNYTVRVINVSVTSSRTGYVPGLMPVMTFRTNASTGTAVAVTDYVGGQNPSVADAADGFIGATMDTATGVFTAGISGTAQSITNVALPNSGITGVDFGFNFNTIVNTNDTGQGSLRQFIININALTNVGLAIQGQPAGQDVSVFMISDGLAHPGLRAGLANQLSAGVAVITPVTALPAITDSNTSVDGTTQTANVGNTNAVMLGTGGTVGIDGLPLSTVPGPEVEIAGSGTLTNGLLIQANNTIVRGLSIHGFGSVVGDAGVRVNAYTGALIEGNVLGSRATTFTDPGAAQRNQAGVSSAGGSNGIVRNNLIGFGRVVGVRLDTGSAGWVVTNNEIRNSGMDTGDGDGITINAASMNTATGNLITGSSSQGIAVTVAGATGNQFINNTVTGNGVGIASSLVQSPGIVLRNGAASTTLDRNVILSNYGAGVQVNNGSTGTRITRNSFALNGTITARNGSGPTGQIAIDLNSPTDNIEFGTPPFVTLNDLNDADAGGNGLLNFPVLTSATIVGGNLVVTGYARPGSLIELFIANPDPSGFGEGETYLITLTEGGTGAGGTDPYADTDAGTGAYGPGAINGIVQGTDNTNRFAFTLPKPGGVSAGTLLTATATLGGETSEFSGLVTVASISLAIVKQAWLPNGSAPLGSPVTAPAGSTIIFLIYVKNTTAIPVTDTRISDILDQTGFDYVSGSLVRTLAASPPADTATDKQLFDATDPSTGTALSDTVDGDVGSALDTGAPAGVDRITIGAVTGQANGSLTINAHSAFALRFKVKIK
jgi:hypothetical protein